MSRSTFVFLNACRFSIRTSSLGVSALALLHCWTAWVMSNTSQPLSRRCTCLDASGSLWQHASNTLSFHPAPMRWCESVLRSTWSRSSALTTRSCCGTEMLNRRRCEVWSADQRQRKNFELIEAMQQIINLLWVCKEKTGENI